MEMKTTTESDSDKRTFNTAAGPVGKYELILYIGKANQTLITLSVLMLFFFSLKITAKHSYKV